MVLPPQSSPSVTGITGKATGSYFESGNGSSSSPYIIATPRQLYYFNWLQDLGYFNTDSDNDGTIDTVYFKIEPRDGGKELDMGKYVLPPAGTSAYPFVGNFNGNGCVISNLTISNSWEELKSSKPATAKQNGEILQSAEIVGFFGIVGQYETTISYDSSANEAKDLYFDNLTVESAASSVLAGFIAGYANGAINNCGIHCGQFSFVSGAKALTGTKLKGESISRFTLIGDYDETSKNFVWEGRPASGDDDEGNDWGGSIDFYSLNRRLTYITGRQSTATSSGSYSVIDDSGFNSHWKIDIRGFVNNSEKDNPYCYIKANTILPLNVNTDAEDSNSVFYGGEIDGNLTTTYSSSSYQWKTTSFYKNKTSEEDAILSSNTGYLIGGNHTTQSGDIAANVQSLTTGLSNVTSPYDGTMTMYTIDTSQSGNTTSAEVNLTNYQSTFGYTRYKAVREEFDKTMNGLTKVHGFHVYQISDYLTNYEKYITTAKAKINNVTYPSYQFMDSGVNFTLKKGGYITVIAGAYYRKGNLHTLFDLYKVDRDTSGTITGLNRINQIAGTKGSGNYSYYYGSDSTSSNLLFDFSKISATACLNSKKAYYFEIPVNAGDYVIANQSNQNSAYLMYLDIGANASESSGTSGEIQNTNIDFVYKENNALAKITDEGYTPSGVVFSVGGTSIPSSAGLIYFKRESKENTGDETVVVGVAYYTTTGCSIEPSGNGRSKEKEPAAD